jgi:S1-C subfamily serine protease
MYKASVPSIVAINTEWFNDPSDTSRASGFIMRSDGYIVTASHVVQKRIGRTKVIAKKVFVTLLNPQRRPITREAEVIGIDASHQSLLDLVVTSHFESWIVLRTQPVLENSLGISS